MKKKEIKKPTRTISGVAPVAVMVPPRACPHGSCLFCPTLNAPQSYTPESPAVLRAKANDYDSYKQVKARIKMLKSMRHPTDKIELIIMGGTFLSYPKDFRYNFVKGCYDALNEKKSKTLNEAKKINEKSSFRCIAICFETRPDICSDKDIKEMLEYGGTRVELGVQAIDDNIYRKVNRGHSVNDVINATKRLKKAGFKIGYHIMPGIPGSNPKKDIEMFKEIFKNHMYKPDQIKIYPCQVMKGSKLEELYWGGEYVPYSKEIAIKIIKKMIELTPRYCRIMRIMREIPQAYLTAGIVNIDLRKDIEEDIRKKGIKIEEIRFREIGFALRDNRKLNEQLFFNKTRYKASNGWEYFLEIVNKDDLLFGLLRLRLEKNKEKIAMIRELHVYGPASFLGENVLEKWQHRGLGKKLILEAEKIAINKGYKKIKIISGVGVREYYKKLGYKIDKEKIYMEKLLI